MMETTFGDMPRLMRCPHARPKDPTRGNEGSDRTNDHAVLVIRIHVVLDTPRPKRSEH